MFSFISIINASPLFYKQFIPGTHINNVCCIIIPVTRKILHLDLDAFYCAVEELLNPDLTHKAFAVGGSPNKRGVISSCSYAARQFGIHSAMPTAKALSLYPKLILVPGNHPAYADYSAKVMKIIAQLSPLVEQMSIDEAFIDVSDLPQSGKMISKELQRSINDALSLPCSIGVATNKLVAKIANDYGKASNRGSAPPQAITVILPGGEAAFLAPLPVRALLGIGPKTAARLKTLGIITIGDLAHIPDAKLKQLFGESGPELGQRAKGIDDSPLVSEHKVKSISNEVTFERDIADQTKLLQTLRSLSDQVGRRLRKSALAGNTVHLKLRYADFITLTRQITLSQYTDQDNEIYKTVNKLLEQNWLKGHPVRLLGVGISGLGPPIRQLSLWDQGDLHEKKLLKAVDGLKDRFGEKIIRRASHLKNNDQ